MWAQDEISDRDVDLSASEGLPGSPEELVDELLETRRLRDDLLRHLDLAEARLRSAERESGGLRGQLAELRTERSVQDQRLGEALDDARGLRAALEKARQALQETRERIGAQQAQISALTDRVTDHSAERKALEESCRQLRTQADALRERQGQAERDRDLALSVQHELVAEAEHRRTVLAEHERIIAEQRVRIALLEKQITGGAAGAG